MARTKRGFTLLELLIVIAVIAILGSLLLPAVLGSIRKSKIAVAQAQIAHLKAALASYHADMGFFPRRPGPAGTGDALFKNDAAWLYAALMNNRTRAVGGGPNAPYLDRDRKMVSHASASDLDNLGFMSVNPNTSLGVVWLEPLPQEETDAINDTSFQVAHLPGSSAELVFVDPWGNPYVYREWASIPASVKEGLAVKRTFQRWSDGPVETVVDRPHDPNNFDIICLGPDGVFSYGGGDDLGSWQQVSK